MGLDTEEPAPGRSTIRLLIGTGTADVQALATHLEAELVVVPEHDDSSLPRDADHALSPWPWSDFYDSWRNDRDDEPQADQVIVAVWPTEPASPSPLVDLDFYQWIHQYEYLLTQWVAALDVATRRCDDGGAIVAAIEKPAPLDCADAATVTAVAESVEALVRSLARSEGDRSVRVNAVTTPRRVAPEPLVDPKPALGSYPGSLEVETAGAIQILLGDLAAGVTGTIIDADSGRSWR